MPAARARPLRAIRRFLRAPRVIVAEIAVICLVGALGAIVPQRGVTGSVAVEAFRQDWPSLSALVERFGFDSIFRSPGFIVVLALATISLLIVLAEQMRRLRQSWRMTLRERHFDGAPFRRELERPRVPAEEEARPTEEERRVTFHTRGRLGLAGSTVFHLGLLLVIVAGALRALFAVDAATELVVGEQLPASSLPWRQWRGALASPFLLACPLTLDAVKVQRFPSDDLKDLRLELTLHDQGGPRSETVVIHDYLATSAGHLYPDFNYGIAALLEWKQKNGASSKEAALLRHRGRGRFEGSSTGPGGLVAHLRGRLDRAGRVRQSLELRVMRGSALAHQGRLTPGAASAVSNRLRLRLHGLPLWARLRGSRNPGLWLAYVGFALLTLGATVIFTVVKVDTCVIVIPAGDKEQVIVALKAQRFAPLYKERFERLVREQEGAA